MILQSGGATSKRITNTFLSFLPTVSRPESPKQPVLSAHERRAGWVKRICLSVLLAMTLIPFSPNVSAAYLIEVPFDPYWATSKPKAELAATLNSLDKSDTKPCRITEQGVYLYPWDKDARAYSKRPLKAPTPYKDLLVSVLDAWSGDGNHLLYSVRLQNREYSAECDVLTADTRRENQIRVVEFAAKVVNALAFMGAYYPHPRSDDVIQIDYIADGWGITKEATRDESVANLGKFEFESNCRCRFSATGTPLFPVNDPTKVDRSSVRDTPYEQLVLDVAQFPNTDQYLIRVFNKERSTYCTAHWGVRYDARNTLKFLKSLGAGG